MKLTAVTAGLCESGTQATLNIGFDCEIETSFDTIYQWNVRYWVQAIGTQGGVGSGGSQLVTATQEGELDTPIQAADLQGLDVGETYNYDGAATFPVNTLHVPNPDDYVIRVWAIPVTHVETKAKNVILGRILPC